MAKMYSNLPKLPISCSPLLGNWILGSQVYSKKETKNARFLLTSLLHHKIKDRQSVSMYITPSVRLKMECWGKVGCRQKQEI